MNPVQTQQLAQIAQRAESAPHGQRTAIYKAGAAELGVSIQTLQRKLKEVRVAKPRKRRSDAGNSALPLNEARLISAMLLESIRANNKQLSTIERAVERLRSNGLILAGRVDEATGLFRPLTSGAISRALRGYNCTQTNCCRMLPQCRWPAITPTTFGRWTPRSRPSSTLPTAAPR